MAHVLTVERKELIINKEKFIFAIGTARRNATPKRESATIAENMVVINSLDIGSGCIGSNGPSILQLSLPVTLNLVTQSPAPLNLFATDVILYHVRAIAWVRLATLLDAHFYYFILLPFLHLIYLQYLWLSIF